MYRLLMAAALFLFCIGNILIILAFQIRIPEGEPVPEWIYNMQAVGFAVFMSAPYLLVLGLTYKVKSWHVSMCRIPCALASYFTLFNACKEIAGLNNDYSTIQLIVFLIGFGLTLTIQNEFHRKHIGE